ncbi:protein deadpan-like [Anopheles nili]|uniref:protein deadpan-like n=1 Tax=Anopheles nili TaxID=185578 RepID=UPI00237C2CD9|nr:protein deadpan-like [Anopheles nili]
MFSTDQKNPGKDHLIVYSETFPGSGRTAVRAKGFCKPAIEMANPSKLNSHDRQDDYASESYLRRIKAEIRKTNKPIMEKKRRARINNYLNDLKGLLLDAMKKDPVRHSKLEKADILDLTVKHLQDIERRRLSVAMAVDPTVPEKFATGYRECIDEIGLYFDSLGSVDEGLKKRVRKHLESCLAFPMGKAPFPGFGFAGVPLQPPDDINNNTHGLLNRTFANNLSLMFPAGIPFPTGEPSSVPPFQPFPLFTSLRNTSDGMSSSTFPPPRKDPPTDRSSPSVPSPPASPTPAHHDDSDDDEKGTTTLRTPLAKVAGTLSDHNMDRLLAIFPTPPSPEDQPVRSRLGKLGHNFGSSPFMPTSLRSFAVRDDPVDDDERQRRAGESSQGEQKEHSAAAEDDGKDNPANGEMWRPW